MFVFKYHHIQYSLKERECRQVRMLCCIRYLQHPLPDLNLEGNNSTSVTLFNVHVFAAYRKTEKTSNHSSLFFVVHFIAVLPKAIRRRISDNKPLTASVEPKCMTKLNWSHLSRAVNTARCTAITLNVKY